MAFPILTPFPKQKQLREKRGKQGDSSADERARQLAGSGIGAEWTSFQLDDSFLYYFLATKLMLWWGGLVLEATLHLHPPPPPIPQHKQAIHPGCGANLHLQATSTRGQVGGQDLAPFPSSHPLESRV